MSSYMYNLQNIKKETRYQYASVLVVMCMIQKVGQDGYIYTFPLNAQSFLLPTVITIDLLVLSLMTLCRLLCQQTIWVIVVKFFLY